MKAYIKPELKITEEIAEDVYMASGSDFNKCYEVSANIHQKPETGRGDYRIQINAAHDAFDGHHSSHQILILHFNMPVKYISSNGILKSGDGTSVLQIDYSYHNNSVDTIGLGDVIVNAEAGLALNSVYMNCNCFCPQH